METISIEMIWAIASLVIFCGWIYWITKPDRCPKCGETMITYYTNKDTHTYKECPKCGYKEGGNDEGSDSTQREDR